MKVPFVTYPCANCGRQMGYSAKTYNPPACLLCTMRMTREFNAAINRTLDHPRPLMAAQ